MAEKDLCEDIDDDVFRKEISKSEINIESEIEEMNYCTLAVPDKESNNENATFGENNAEYISSVTKLEEENRHWDEIFARYRDNCEKEMKTEEIQFKGQFNLEKYQHMDYSTIWEDVKSIDTHLNFQMTKLKERCHFLSRYIKLSHKGISSWNRTAGKTFMNTLGDSPRKLIKICF
ncbi:unnamed protein product [Larinioides sclopetarius]